MQDFGDTIKKEQHIVKDEQCFLFQAFFLINLQLLSDQERCDASKPGESCRRKVSVETSEKVRN